MKKKKTYEVKAEEIKGWHNKGRMITEKMEEKWHCKINKSKTEEWRTGGETK